MLIFTEEEDTVSTSLNLEIPIKSGYLFLAEKQSAKFSQLCSKTFYAFWGYMENLDSKTNPSRGTKTLQIKTEKTFERLPMITSTSSYITGGTWV